MEDRTGRYEASGVLNSMRISKGFGKLYTMDTFGNIPVESVTVDEARKILDRALGNESLYECVRQERDER